MVHTDVPVEQTDGMPRGLFLHSLLWDQLHVGRPDQTPSQNRETRAASAWSCLLQDLIRRLATLNQNRAAMGRSSRLGFNKKKRSHNKAKLEQKHLSALRGLLGNDGLEGKAAPSEVIRVSTRRGLEEVWEVTVHGHDVLNSHQNIGLKDVVNEKPLAKHPCSPSMMLPW